MSIADDGTPTVLGALATPSAQENHITVASTSVNLGAASGAAKYTFVVNVSLATSFSMMTGQITSTPVATRIVRLDPAGAAVGSPTDAGLDAGGSMRLPAFNTGTIYAVESINGVTPTFKLATISATGGATLNALDLTGAGLTNATYSVLTTAVPANETTLYLTAANATGVQPVFVKLSDSSVSFGEKINFTRTSGKGVASTYFLGSDKNLYWSVTTTDSAAYQTLYKWVDPRWTAPVGPVPAATSADVKYSLNTPTSGSKITLSGTNLDIVTAATIGGVAATIGTKSATTLQLTIPTQSSSGAKDIVLTYPDGTVTASAQLTYLGTGAPQTVTLDAFGATATVGDADVAITGTVTASPADAGSVSAIALTSTTTSVCTIVSGKVHFVAFGTCSVTATAAANGLLAAGTATATITVGNPTATYVSKDVKYALNTPAAGTKVTITGTHLDLVASATIGGVVANIGTKSATSLQLTIPAASAAGDASIVLTTTDSSTVNAGIITYVGTGVAQSVVIGSLAATATVGDADLTPTASVSASPSDAGTVSAITWSSTTTSVCTIVAGKIHFVSAGTCSVTASAAANGLLLAGTDSKSITVSAAVQTITLSAPTGVQVDLDGFDLTASTTSGLVLTFATTTTDICSVDAATGHVTGLMAGDCVVSASQAGSAAWASATQSLTITIAAADTTPVVDNGDPANPVVTPKTGAWVTKGDTSIAWNRAKGTLAFKLTTYYVGPVTATLTFKSGKNFTCKVSFGLLKKQASSKKLVIVSPNFCSAKTDTAALAALKKIPANTSVKINIVRDLRVATTYAKTRIRTRNIYVKLG